MSIQFSKRRASDGGTSGSISAGGSMENMAELSSDETNVSAAGSLSEMNQDVVRVILESKKDIWKNFEMLQLVNDYFKNSIRKSDCFTVLETSLKKARDSQLIVELVIKCLDEEYAVVVAADDEDQPPEVKRKTRYAKTLDELRLFKAIGHPFTDEFYNAFQSVYQQQLSMLEKL